MSGSAPDGPVVLRACVRWTHGVDVASGHEADHSTVAARSCASPAADVPATAGQWLRARRRALRGCGYTLGQQWVSAPTAQVGKGVWCSCACIIRAMDTGEQVLRTTTT